MTDKQPPSAPLPLKDMLLYGAGAFANNLQAAASGGMMIVLNLGFGMSPALVGVLSAIPRLADAISDPVMGFISDNTKSRWGRRRPYMFCGILVAGLIFALMWQVPESKSDEFYFVYFLVALIVFFLCYTVYSTPWVALGYELTPDYHERTKLMGVQNFIGQIPFLILAPWFLWFMELDTFGTMATGASVLAIVVAVLCVVTGLVPAIFLRERFTEFVTPDKVAVRSSRVEGVLVVIGNFMSGFAETVKNSDFLKLAGATFLVFNGFQLIGAFQSYVIIYYVFAGDRDAGGFLLGLFGTVSSIATFTVIGITTFLSTRIGKKNTFFVMIGISTAGYLLKWVCYSTEFPELILLTALLIPFGLGALFTLMGSMIADVCDEDELATGERREGMYGSIFWWVVKLGMSVALLLGGILLEVTGFDVDLPAQSDRTLFLLRWFDVIVPTVSSLLAILLIATYSITEERAYGIRQELEARRGAI